MIVPTSEAGIFTAEKGTVLGKFILYFLCTGQQKADLLGYSPLPRNLVQFGFDAVRHIPGAPRLPAITACKNPTITGDFKDPPPPPPARRPTTYHPAGAAVGRVGGGTRDDHHARHQPDGALVRRPNGNDRDQAASRPRQPADPPPVRPR